MMTDVLAALFGAFALLGVGVPASSSSAPTSCGIEKEWCTHQAEIIARMSGVEFVKAPRRPDPYRYEYTAECLEEQNMPWYLADRCIDGYLPTPADDCANGAMTPPRWARLINDGTGRPGPWLLQAGFSCPGDPDYPISYDDFAVLPIAPSPIQLQPDTGWVYTGLDTIAMTDPAAQGFEVELRGSRFLVGAVPVEYEWDFGDGSPPLVTTDPGKPWPDQTVTHTYSAAGTAAPTLTTRWRGVFRTSSTSPWHEIPGTAETTTTGPELTIYSPRPRLVDDPLS